MRYNKVKPDITNSDQVCELTSDAYVTGLKENSRKINIRGKGNNTIMECSCTPAET